MIPDPALHAEARTWIQSLRQLEQAGTRQDRILEVVEAALQHAEFLQQFTDRLQQKREGHIRLADSYAGALSDMRTQHQCYADAYREAAWEAEIMWKSLAREDLGHVG